MTLSKGSAKGNILFYYYYYFIPNLLAAHALTGCTVLTFAGFGSAAGSQETETQIVFRCVEY